MRDDEKDDDSSDYTSSSPSSDDTPPEAAVYAFVPPRSNTTAADVRQHSRPAPGTNKPVLPPSLREQSLLVVKQRSTQQRDELDELLHMDDGRGAGVAMADRTAVASGDNTRQKAAKENELRNLEDALDDLLNV